MALYRRTLPGFVAEGLRVLGAIARGADVLAGFAGEVRADEVRRAFPDVTLTGARGFSLARILGAWPEAVSSEMGLLAGRNVVFACLGNEPAEAVPDWLAWHRRVQGAEGALIYAGAERGAALAEALGGAAEAMDLVLVDGDRAFGTDSFALFELLRHGFLGRARAVACLSVADLVERDPHGSIFDRAAGLPGQALELSGTEAFPMGRARPISHGAHGAVRLREVRRLTSWCVAPETCPESAVWRPNRIAGMPVAEVRRARFRRAMGVACPGVPVDRLAGQAELVADDDFARTLAGVFETGSDPGPVRPAEREDSGPVTVVTAMKNEGPFILDWIAHHRVVGVDRFLVYTNDCADGTDRILDLLGEAGAVRRENPFRETGRVPQHAAFRAAKKEGVVRTAGWLMTLDVDEYLNLRPGAGRIADLLDAVPGADAISLSWRLFGNAGVHRYSDRPVTEQFTRAAPDHVPRPLQAWAFKTLYRNDGSFRRLGVHRPKALDAARAGTLRWVDGSGRPLPTRMWQGGWRATEETWGYELGAVNHYAVRSAESFLVKRERGRVNHVDRDQGLAYWFRMNHNVIEERSIRRLDVEVAAERARLAALPGVAEAHDRAVAWHRARIAKLKRDADMAALYAQLTSERMEKLSRLTPNFGSQVFYDGPEAIPDEVVAQEPGSRFYFTY